MIFVLLNRMLEKYDYWSDKNGTYIHDIWNPNKEKTLLILQKQIIMQRVAHALLLADTFF